MELRRVEPTAGLTPRRSNQSINPPAKNFVVAVRSADPCHEIDHGSGR
jgi:hypothetical protein